MDGHFTANLDAQIEVREPGWLALRIPMNRPYTDRAQYTGPGANIFGKALFAPTSPSYVTMGGCSVRQATAVAHLVADLEECIERVRELGAFAAEDEREAVLSIYRNAIRKLRTSR